MRVLFNLAIVAHERGDLAETVRVTTRAVERARELGVEWAFYPSELRHLHVVATYMAGDWDASAAAADQLARVPDMAAHVRAAGLLVQVGRGDPAVRERIAWAHGLATRRGTPVMLVVTAAAAEIDLATWAGDAGTALRRAGEASRRLAEFWPVDRMASVRLVASALGAAGDAAAAARLVGDQATAHRWVAEGEALLPLVAESVAAYSAFGARVGPEGQAWQARLAAEAARLRGEAAVDRWRAVVEAFGALGHVYEQARSRLRLAEALLAADDRAGAAAELRAAHEVAVGLGAAPLRAAVEALARRGRLELPGAGRVPDVAAVLTPREAEVLGLLAQGRTNRQIGAALYISEKTASVHVSNILAKLGAGSRTEAVAIAAAKGLLPPTTSS
jgi:DNA-binding CsgD family transcriptional regulator